MSKRRDVFVSALTCALIGEMVTVNVATDGPVAPGTLPAVGSRRWLVSVCWAVAALILVVFGVALVLRIDGPAGVLRIDDLTQLGSAGLAAAGSAWAARRGTGRVRAAWAAVAAGAAMWASGQLLWCYYELIAGRVTPFPSLADAGYLLFPVGAAAGLWLLPTIRGGGTRGRWLLDGGIIVSSLVTVSWATSLGAVARAGGDSRFAFAVSLAYPIGDILILTMAILALCRPRTDRGELALLSVAMAAMAIADSAFAYLNATGKYRTGSLSDIGWVAAFLLLAVAGVIAATRRSPGRTAAPAVAADRPAASTMLPYLPLLGAAVILGVRRVQGHDVDTVEFVSVSMAFAMVLARQYLTVRENRALVRVVDAREQQLHRQAFHDQLTGLANRALFLNRADHALDLHRRDLRPISVLFCDLDDFKTVNDTLGHAAGDELLIRVAERLRGALRPGDTLARLGGDEFAVLLEDGDEPALVGGRLVHALHDPFTLDGLIVTVRASVGVTHLRSDEQTPTVDGLLAQADIAMYAAKRAGKAQLASYDPAMVTAGTDDLILRQPLVDAITDHRIQIAYQPIVDIDSGAVVGVEALARWTNNGTAVPPQRFIPLARRAGMLGELTDQMLEQACAQMAAWSAQIGHRRLHVAVNIPPSTITDRGFPAVISALLGRHALDPAQLVLEITEEALLDDLPVAREVTRLLREIGVRMSLDDFGTGYSSLLHLQTVHLDSLKIDGRFTSTIDTDPQAEHLLDGILILAAHLGLDVVAEGIERQTQADTLHRLGCRLAQGFLYAEPTDPAQIAPLLPAKPGHSHQPKAAPATP